MSGVAAAVAKGSVVRGVYRQIFRAARQWEGPEVERQYMRDEARRLFTANKELPGELVEDRLAEATARLELALHYRNPYPRVYNVIKATPEELAKDALGTLRGQRPSYLQTSYAPLDSPAQTTPSAANLSRQETIRLHSSRYTAEELVEGFKPTEARTAQATAPPAPGANRPASDLNSDF